MQSADYHKKIIEYYKDTENAYKDSWDLNNSLAIHYGYWDEKVKSFPESLLRMNEVMIETAGIKPTDKVLDAGCGVGGSSIFMASVLGCNVTGITLSKRQVQQANENAAKKNVAELVNFKAINYSATDFPDASFDVALELLCLILNEAILIRLKFFLMVLPMMNTWILLKMFFANCLIHLKIGFI